MDQCGYLTGVYRDCLAAEAKAYGVELTIDQYGAPQIVKLLDMIEIFSRRTAEIEALIDRIEETHQALIFWPSQSPHPASARPFLMAALLFQLFGLLPLLAWYNGGLNSAAHTTLEERED